VTLDVPFDIDMPEFTPIFEAPTSYLPLNVTKTMNATEWSYQLSQAILIDPDDTFTLLADFGEAATFIQLDES